MKATVRRRLFQINRAFYEQFAGAFAATRYGAQPGWQHIIPYFPDPCQVLDVGCGNGRFAHFLDQHLQHVSYTGLDGSEGLLEIARASADVLQHVDPIFRQIDLASEGWHTSYVGQFHVAVALAVLHHIPDTVWRRSFLQAAAACLRPSGVLILSTWRFTHRARMQRKIVPWARAGLGADEVEDGDYLLIWKAGGAAGLRYAHECTQAEIRTLAAAINCSVESQFLADGREGDLSLYSVLRPRLQE